MAWEVQDSITNETLEYDVLIFCRTIMSQIGS